MSTPAREYNIRKAVREPTTVLVALAGPSGSGKTVSGLRLAIGLARGHRNGRAIMIDTEHRRGTHHADTYDYDYLEMKPPFSTEAYRDMVEHCDGLGYGAIFVDSMSHEWNGEGGCQYVHDMAIQRMAKGDAGKVEALDGLAWSEAKIPHKRMMGRFVRLDAHIVFGLRAEEKIKYVKEGDKTKVVQLGFMPICEKGFMFEMLTSFLLLPESAGGTPGWPARAFKIDGRHKPFFKADRLIDEESGALLAGWARANPGGGAANTMTEPVPVSAVHAPAPPSPTTQVPSPPGTQVPDEREALKAEIAEHMRRLGYTGKQQLDDYSTYLGERTGRAMQTCPLPNLQALRDALAAKQVPA